jgi:hypothetical protein
MQKTVKQRLIEATIPRVWHIRDLKPRKSLFREEQKPIFLNLIGWGKTALGFKFLLSSLFVGRNPLYRIELSQALSSKFHLLENDFLKKKPKNSRKII